MESSNRIVCLLLAVILMISTTSAYDFYVGGADGWVQTPSEKYNDWSGTIRFEVNDKLVFKYKKGEDSVLVVNKEDYDSCNLSNPMKKLDDGNSVFQFNRSGPFSFISGEPGKCDKGQKLTVIVMADPTSPPPPSASSSPSTPSSPTPTPSLSESPSPSPSPSVAPAPADQSSASVSTLSSSSLVMLVLLLGSALLV